jgi:transcriptional regulator with XRE-family HTH domain
MKTYNSLGELLADYRKCNNLCQIDIASLLDVDVRTVSRWEKNETLIKADKEAVIVERLFIPYQVIRNLNSENPISVYYDIKNRTYSLAALMTKIKSASWFKSNLPAEDEKIHTVSDKADVDFILDIQSKSNGAKPVRPEIITEAAKLLPDLNLVIFDSSGYYAGHICILPLKYNSYLKIKNREIKNHNLAVSDLSGNFANKPLVFYFYSIYADSFVSAYYLIKRLLTYFERKKFDDYLFAGITYRENQIELLKEMGLKLIWTESPDEHNSPKRTLLEGNLDMFIFGKMI